MPGTCTFLDLLTTNLEFSKWGGIFTDDQMAAAMFFCQGQALDVSNVAYEHWFLFSSI
ncbi:MAG: hypothetical protein ACLRJY_15200 [Anaerobutyricum soehngenii]